MEKVSLRVSSVFPAAPIFTALQSKERVLKQKAKPPVTHGHFSALKVSIIGACRRCRDVTVPFQ